MDAPVRPARLASVDALRGLVMVLMALDHVRDFFSHTRFDPLDLSRTTTALFFTRWITHFCAPVFVFLAGAAAFLALAGGKPRGELARFLLVRGLWLILLELTVVHVGWFFTLDHSFGMLQVIWALGWSMIALAGLVFLPPRVVLLIGLALIAGHNLLDGIRPAHWGEWDWLWMLLHEQGLLQPAPGITFLVVYPLLPWVGVMAAGFGFGELLRWEPRRRTRWLLTLGAGMVALFILLRATNLYGDPFPWRGQESTLLTLLSFLNCTKYPPSLLYLLMTLGPALLALALLERGRGPLLRPLILFGRVPLFYYLVHLPLIHALAVGVAYVRHGRAGWLFDTGIFGGSNGRPPDDGFTLPGVYLAWALVILLLFPLCAWFAAVKARHRGGWLSYL